VTRIHPLCFGIVDFELAPRNLEALLIPRDSLEIIELIDSSVRLGIYLPSKFSAWNFVNSLPRDAASYECNSIEMGTSARALHFLFHLSRRLDLPPPSGGLHALAESLNLFDEWCTPARAP